MCNGISSKFPVSEQQGGQRRCRCLPEDQEQMQVKLHRQCYWSSSNDESGQERRKVVVSVNVYTRVGDISRFVRGISRGFCDCLHQDRRYLVIFVSVYTRTGISRGFCEFIHQDGDILWFL
ncbi:hypothetical protein RRG08_063006 [Elysia crispata]|uniref:Uncharacterized protein n=1 Tax=Elysia crispata TaxID=231223 RepID=A0AAE0YL40_9GAST|nr:hypothetical protein RRG08_063006 [Elysia crispata]